MEVTMNRKFIVLLLTVFFLSGCTYLSKNLITIDGAGECNMITKICKGDNVQMKLERRMYLNMWQPNSIKKADKFNDPKREIRID